MSIDDYLRWNTGFITGTLWVDIMMIVIIVIFLIFSAFFSATETALSTSNLIRLKKLAEEKRRGARKAVVMIENYNRTLTCILIGNNLVNIGASTISALIFTTLINDQTLASFASTFIMTMIVITFGEILPKTYAKTDSTKLAMRFAPIMWIFYKIFYPIGLLFMGLQKLIKPKDKDHIVTGDELETIIDTMEDKGIIDEDHADLIQSALTLADKTVYDIMTPRVDMVAIEVNYSVDEILNQFFESQYSRLPVYEGDKDNIIGVLQEKDFLGAVIKKGKNNVNIRTLIQEPIFVTKTTRVDDLIKEMQEAKRHFAIVSDEYGGTSGIVTMEDALEELVGEIYDEYDKDEDDYEINKIGENLYEMSSEVEMEELFEYLDIGIPDTKYATIGGFVYDLMEGLPSVGDKASFMTSKIVFEDEKVIDVIYKLIFKITEVENRRVRRLTLFVEEIDEETIEE